MEGLAAQKFLEALGIGGGTAGGLGGLLLLWKLLKGKNGDKTNYVDERLCTARHETVEAEFNGVREVIQGTNQRLDLVIPLLEALPKRRKD